MSAPEWVLIIGAAGLWLERIIARVQAGPQREQVIAAIAGVKDTAVEIRQQTNGASEQQLRKIAEQAVEIGRLQGMVAGLTAMRIGARATDAVASLPAPVVLPPT